MVRDMGPPPPPPAPQAEDLNAAEGSAAAAEDSQLAGLADEQARVLRRPRRRKHFTNYFADLGPGPEPAPPPASPKVPKRRKKPAPGATPDVPPADMSVPEFDEPMGAVEEPAGGASRTGARPRGKAAGKIGKIRRPVGERGTDAIDRHIGQRLKKRRQALRLTLEQVADGCQLSHQQMSRLEAGQNRVMVSLLTHLAWLLNVDPTYFFEGLKEPAPPEARSRQRAPRIFRDLEALPPSVYEKVDRFVGELEEETALRERTRRR